jgi:succinyl-diaminopimelate desuccinylase
LNLLNALYKRQNISTAMDVIKLTQDLLAFNNINPPGNEESVAVFTGNILAAHGFMVSYHRFGEGRLHMIAEKGVRDGMAALVLSGHFDTVPLGAREWSVDPFSGKTGEDRLWGRGSSDMKGGLAAMVIAAIEAFNEAPPTGGVRLIFTAAEELGCIGAKQLAAEWTHPGKASAIIVGEPTSNHPYIGHKGAVYMNATGTGKTAHSSMPHLGDNAIYKVAEAILKVKDFDLNTEMDPLLGLPTINVGRMNGGMNINSVPDRAEFSIDIRTTAKADHDKLIAGLKERLGKEISLEILVNMLAVSTDANNSFVRLVYDVCGIDPTDSSKPKALPYLTDGSVLQKLYNGAPTIILGPGQPEMAHQTDEYIFIDKLIESVNIYKNILLKWKI